VSHGHDRSDELFSQSRAAVAGGVSSQIRRAEPGGRPLFFAPAEGSRMWDVDGNEHLDYSVGMGPNLFGHAPAFINERVAAEAALEEIGSAPRRH
jgi:glutamate-1-semialdehyde 2,1-aminomutase